MKTTTRNRSLLSFFICMLTGAGVLALLSLIRETPLPKQGEYFMISFFRNQISWLSLSLFALLGFLASYFLRWNPWIVAFGLISVLPMTALVEGAIFRGSHNLLPFEFVMYSFYALPGLASALLGRFLKNPGQRPAA